MGRLTGLDALRGIAALMVFGTHLQGFYGLPIILSGQARAVDLFFVLSGFVLARTYEHRMPGPARFLRLRYRRLFPAAAVGALLGLLFAIQHETAPGVLAAFLALLVFLPALWLREPFLLNAPAWSLFVEIVANIVHSAALVRISARVLAFVAVLGMLVYLPQLLDDPLTGIPDARSILPALGRGVAGYATGILIWRKWGDAPWTGLKPIWAIVGLPFLVIAFQALGAIGAVAFTFIVAPLIVRVSIGLGSSRTASFLGSLSYPLYAVHYPILGMCLAYGVGAPVAALLSLAAAAMVATLIDRPLSARRGGPARGSLPPQPASAGLADRQVSGGGDLQ